MIRRSPAEVYTKYLLLHPRGYTDDEVGRILEYANLPHLGGWYLKKLKDDLVKPDPFYPFDARHLPSRAFLLTERLGWIFAPDEYGKQAFEILELPRVREFVETMLLAHAPPVSIAGVLARRYDFACTETSVVRYKDFFWNVDLLDATEMRAILELQQIRLATSTDPDMAMQAAALKYPLFRDARRAAADMPFTPFAAMSTQVKLGIFPGKLDQPKLLEQASGLLMMRVLEAATHDGKDASNKAMNWSIALGKIMEAKEKVADPTADITEQLQRVVYRTDNSPVPTFQQLKGTHTIDVVGQEVSTTDSVPLSEVEDEDDDEEP